MRLSNEAKEMEMEKENFMMLASDRERCMHIQFGKRSMQLTPL